MHVDEERARELEEVLALAEQFPARHDDVLPYPPFPPARPSEETTTA